MNLGLQGKTALICASSKGLGKACAMSLADEGVHVTITGRDPVILEATANAIRANSPMVIVKAVAADLTTAQGRALILSACPAPDILVTNNGGPPPGDFRNWSREDWIAALDMNMLAPIEMIKATIDPMIERRWGRIINITSSAVKNPLEMLGLSNGARSGLTGFVAGLARTVSNKGVTINNVLPGPHKTDRLLSVMDKMPPNARPTRIGEPRDFGAVCAFLCSTHTDFITGQNWLIDGGSFPGTF